MILSWLPIILCGLVALFVFYISPQLAKFRATTGIDRQLASSELTATQKLWLSLLGLKTPFLTTLSTIFSFILTESDQLAGFGWDKFISKDHAATVVAVLWALSLYSHFSGLQYAASAAPVTPPKRQRNKS